MISARGMHHQNVLLVLVLLVVCGGRRPRILHAHHGAANRRNGLLFTGCIRICEDGADDNASVHSVGKDDDQRWEWMCNHKIHTVERIVPAGGWMDVCWREVSPTAWEHLWSMYSMYVHRYAHDVVSTYVRTLMSDPDLFVPHQSPITTTTMEVCRTRLPLQPNPRATGCVSM